VPLTARDFDRVVNKLGMKGRANDHRFVFLEHEGKQVVYTLRSHGRGDLGSTEFAIRKQLHVTQDQLRNLAACPMSRDEYIAHLKEKKIIIVPDADATSNEQAAAQPDEPNGKGKG
jgi:hypothetical protein